MDMNLLIICALTLVIHMVGTLAYAVRIAGVRTRRIAISFSLFNILVLVSRTSNSFQGPFLAKRIESRLITGDAAPPLLHDFRYLLFTTTVATLAGAVLVPTFQRLFSGAVHHFQTHRSLLRLAQFAFTSRGLSSIKGGICMPSAPNVTRLSSGAVVSSPVIALNVFAMALWTL